MDNEDLRSKRKDQHVKHVLKQTQSMNNDFDLVHLIHQSLPKYNLTDVDLSTKFGDIHWQTPIYINAMTGGSEWTRSINEKLALVAKSTGMPMALGSMHASVKNSALKDTFRIARDVNPDGFLMANVGADVSVEGALTAIELINADALQIHINVAQELVMPEGDRSFDTWLSNIENIVEQASVPVIVKEVGFGMSFETIQQLIDLGVEYIDVSGKGGTNFAMIENLRRKHQEMDYLSSWGQSTAVSLIESMSFQNQVSVLASGGVQTPLDAVKCLALGANAVGISKTVLDKIMNDGVDSTIAYIDDFIYQMKKISVLINANNIKGVQSAPYYLDPKLEHWKASRGIE